MQGEFETVTLASRTFLNGTAVETSEGSVALYPYLWQLRGSDCTMRTDVGSALGWPDAAVACNASLADSEVLPDCSSGKMHM